VPDLNPIIDTEADSSILEHGSSDVVTKDNILTLLTFTNNGPGDAFIDAIRGECTADAEFFVTVDTVQKDSMRTSIASPTAQFLFPNKGLKIPKDSVVAVRVAQHVDTTAQARASMFGHRNG
jgi:hypothetical protein